MATLIVPTRGGTRTNNSTLFRDTSDPTARAAFLGIPAGGGGGGGAPAGPSAADLAAEAALRRRLEEERAAAEAARKREEWLQQSGYYARPSWRYAGQLDIPVAPAARPGTVYRQSLEVPTQVPGASVADEAGQRRRLMIQRRAAIESGGTTGMPIGYASK